MEPASDIGYGTGSKPFFIWELLEDRAVIASFPSGSRSYRNVSLHVSRANGIGKGQMVEKQKERIPRLLDDLQQRLSPERKVFLCCHRDVYDDVRQIMQERQLAVSIIQAINRVQCRKVIDQLGNCALTDVFIVLPRGRSGDAILEAIQIEMPAIVIAEWDFDLDDETKKEPKVRRGSSHEAIVSYMRNQSPGEIDVKTIKRDLDISETVWKESIAPALRQSDHPLTRSLAALGVSYFVEGKGRGARSLLAKL